MSNVEQVQEIELEISQARDLVKKGEALQRLSQNADFKNIIMDDYFRELPIRLVGLRAAPSMQDPDVQADILGDIDAIGRLQQFFNSIVAQANTAEEAIESGHQELAAVEAEDSDDE